MFACLIWCCSTLLVRGDFMSHVVPIVPIGDATLITLAALEVLAKEKAEARCGIKCSGDRLRDPLGSDRSLRHSTES